MNSISGKNENPINSKTGKPCVVRFQFNQVYAGSRKKLVSLTEVKQSHKDHSIFNSFTASLNWYLTNWFLLLPTEELLDISRDASERLKANFELSHKVRADVTLSLHRSANSSRDNRMLLPSSRLQIKSHLEEGH